MRFNIFFKLMVNKRNINFFFLLIVLSFISIFLELVGLGLLIPVVSVLFDVNSFANLLNQYQQFVPNFLLNISSEAYVSILLILIFFIFIIKNIYLFLYTKLAHQFLAKMEVDLSKKILSNYLEQNYKFFISNKSSTILARLTKDIPIFSKSTLFSIIVFVTELLLLCSFAVLVVIFNIEKFLFIALFFLSIGFFFIKLLSSRSRKLGALRQDLDSSRIKALTRITTSIRELILYGKKDNLLKNYMEETTSLSRVAAKHDASLYYPKLIFESFAILSFVMLLFFLTNNNYPSSYIVTISAFFLGATYRIIPSLNKISSSIQSISYGLKTLDILYYDISLKPEISFTKDKISFSNNIVFENIAFSHDLVRNNSILLNTNLEILKNQKVAIIGPSGSGKSTFTDMLTCLILPQEGKMKIDGLTIDDPLLARKWQNCISYVSQNPSLFDDTILNNITLATDNNAIDARLLEEVVEASVLTNFINSLPNKLNTEVGEIGNQLSGGQRQRIAIARALYHKKQVLIFDEATNAINSEIENKIFDYILCNKELTFFAISHQLSNFKRFDRKITIKNQNMVEIN